MPLSQFETNAPFSAVVDTVSAWTNDASPSNWVVTIGLKTTDGRYISPGGFDEGYKLADFAESLEEGKIYEFPKAWIEFRDRNKK